MKESTNCQTDRYTYNWHLQQLHTLKSMKYMKYVHFVISWTEQTEKNKDRDTMCMWIFSRPSLFSCPALYIVIMTLPYSDWALTPMSDSSLLGPFYVAIAVPSVTRCRRRRRCCGHRCAGGVLRDSSDTWWMAMRRAAARSGEWVQHFSNASCLESKIRK